MSAVGVLWLIACANIATLLLARATGRTHEIALRAALAADRGRVVRQLLTESCVHAGVAGLAGLLLASMLMQGVVALSPANLPRIGDVRMDTTVLLFAFGLSLTSTLLFGLVPALHASRLNLSDALKRSGSKLTVSGANTRLRSGLVVAEVALSVILLVTAGLLVRSLLALQHVDLGFAKDRVLVAYTEYAVENEAEIGARIRFYADVLDRLRAVPGVSAAAGVAYVGMGLEPRTPRDYSIEGRPLARAGERPQAEFHAVTEDYFKTLEIPLLAGRDFARTDTRDTPQVVIINEEMARAAFPGESPIGKRLRTGTSLRAPSMEIIGVVGDARMQDPSQPAQQVIYAASNQGLGNSPSILARTSLDEASLVTTLRRLLNDANPTVPVKFKTMDELFDDTLAYPRFRSQVIGLFAALATVLAAVGIFSVLAYLVGQRTKELAVRRALGVAAFTGAAQTTLGGEAPQELFGVIVSCNYFEVLQQTPSLGRGVTAQDCAPGAEPVVVLSHQLCRTTFAAEPQILGRTITMNRRPFTVVGVAAEGADVGTTFRTAYYAPITTDSLLRRTRSLYDNDKQHWLNLIGRRSPGTGIDQVRAELGVIAAQIDGLEPGRSTTLTIERATPMTPLERSAAMSAAAVLMAAFGLILLIACANVANLLLARGASRSQEIGICLSLGAGRARVVRQLLTESMLISVAGGLFGSALALWSFQSLFALAVDALSLRAFAWNFSPDFRVLSFAAALTFGSGFLFGLAPALHVSKQDLQSVIKQDSAGAGGSRRGWRLRGTLIGVQVAVCMALMIAAGLLLRGLYATHTTDPGFGYRDVAYVSLESVLDAYESAELAVLRQRLTAEIAALPGVEAVAYTDRGPLGFDFSAAEIRLPGESENESRVAELNWVTPQYFDVLGLPIVRGRTFSQTEVPASATGARPAIVSETTARNLWPGSDPVGRTLLWTMPGGETNTLQIVGVAADAQVSAIGRIDPYYVYIPGGGAVLLVKTRTGLAATLPVIRKTVQALEPVLAPRVLPLETNLGFWRGLSGVLASLGAASGVLALVLASVGVYGVVSYSVSRRYREIAIRLALGAKHSQALGTMLLQTMRPVIAGGAVGLAAAVAISRILSSVLFGVSPADPIGFGGAALLVVLVALAAGLIAARPATRADASTALRHE
jgi:predicted permease